MKHSGAQRIPSSLSKASGTDLARLQLERALRLADADESPLADKIAEAADAAGADLLFVLPAPDGEGMSAVVRFCGAGADHFLQIRTGESGITISRDDEIDPLFLRLAQRSVDVLQRINADPDVCKPLTASPTY